jgi:hypothetical protein
MTLEKPYLHCAQGLRNGARYEIIQNSHPSGLWDEERWPAIEMLPTLGRILVEHAKLPDSPVVLQATIDNLYQEQLY